jgi:hypothetical protein
VINAQADENGTTGIEKMKMQRPEFGYRSLTRVCRAQSLWQSRAEIDGVATEKDMSGTMDVPRDRRSSRKRRSDHQFPSAKVGA